MFEGFGIEKLMMILLIVLVLFGGKRIPEIGSSLGKGIREFKRGIKDMGDTLNADEDLPRARPVASLPAQSMNSDAVAYDDGQRAPKRLIDT